MIERRIVPGVEALLKQSPAVVLTGPRQVGKTTLALQIAGGRPSTYLDLESPADRARLSEPELYLEDHADELLVLDEIQRLPDLFEVLRGAIDRGRREGKRNGRFLLLGSASLELLAQSGESLAGRIAFAELTPLDVTEVNGEDLDRLWTRGGFPESFLAGGEDASLRWRRDFIRTYLERDIPQLGPRIPAETLRRLWTMLAHGQGGLLNAANIARGLGVSGATVGNYLDLMVDLLLVRRLPPRLANVGKRLVRSPKVYVRDSGLLHALLGIADKEALLGHPVAGGSWEGLVIENLIAVAGPDVEPSFYRTSGGAEVDLVLSWPDGREWAIEVKRTLSPKLERGLRSALGDIEPERCFLVYPGEDRFPLGGGVEAISLPELCAELSSRWGSGASPRRRRSPAKPASVR
ncbi:MAG TPA: ATP-binding protein [Solirubrobacterales bacterium]|nr:ATP-binding protein [Solirubrobacterales bacterium]